MNSNLNATVTDGRVFMRVSDGESLIVDNGKFEIDGNELKILATEYWGGPKQGHTLSLNFPAKSGYYDFYDLLVSKTTYIQYNADAFHFEFVPLKGQGAVMVDEVTGKMVGVFNLSLRILPSNPPGPATLEVQIVVEANIVSLG